MLEEVGGFSVRILTLIQQKGVDLSDLVFDHVAYTVFAKSDFEEAKKEISEKGKLIHGNEVGSAFVEVYLLDDPVKVHFEGQPISVQTIELVFYTDGEAAGKAAKRPYWEHVEMIPKDGLEKFLEKYTETGIDSSRKDRDIFPMLVLDLGDGLKAKFPRRPAAEESKRLKELGGGQTAG